MADTYASFDALAAEKEEGVHYSISFTPRDSAVLLLAPHGGEIEPATSEIAAAVAADYYGLYLFEGIQPVGNYADLHITSENFDEPRGLQGVAQARIVVAVHGYGDLERAFVMVGGLDQSLGKKIECFLSRAGFVVEPTVAGIRGRSPNNICNRGQNGRGCQLEISRALRESLLGHPGSLERFAKAIRRAIRDEVTLMAEPRSEDERDPRE